MQYASHDDISFVDYGIICILFLDFFSLCSFFKKELDVELQKLFIDTDFVYEYG